MAHAFRILALGVGCLPPMKWRRCPLPRLFRHPLRFWKDNIMSNERRAISHLRRMSEVVFVAYFNISMTQFFGGTTEKKYRSLNESFLDRNSSLEQVFGVATKQSALHWTKTFLGIGSRSLSQQILCLLRKPKTRRRVQNRSPLGLALNYINPAHTIIYHSLKILVSTLNAWVFHSGFPTKILFLFIISTRLSHSSCISTADHLRKTNLSIQQQSTETNCEKDSFHVDPPCTCAESFTLRNTEKCQLHSSSPRLVITSSILLPALSTRSGTPMN